ncbi:zinc ABC transporter ATP-binding protein ZnuC [Spirabiliibacterium pneumoniae]|uniref:zinc ABC transporter ATP-binding protein ZnuC n=1 Tax=Spirabiliibacterium pneumoniae TaxID=221400 RepID=UPI002E286C9E|nr:zinc ABC transporter ATP-binding protein ZnuC [Spirabiliibacterium pneumoniae]
MTTQPSPLIELQDITVMVGDKTILSHINLRLFPNTVTTIVGPNGGGKSTLLKVLLKLISPSSGRVKHATGVRIGYVPQKIHLDPTLPITVKKFLSLNRFCNKQARDDVLDELKIAHLKNQTMHKLSGGEMQRVLLARALLNRPNLLVLDEPVQGVDITGQAELYQLINHSKSKFNCAVLMVSHDLHIVMANTDHVLCVNQHLCCAGTPQAVSEHPQFIQYFGDQFAQTFALYTHHHNHKHNLHGDVCCANSQPTNDNTVCQHKD